MYPSQLWRQYDGVAFPRTTLPKVLQGLHHHSSSLLADDADRAAVLHTGLGKGLSRGQLLVSCEHRVHVVRAGWVLPPQGAPEGKHCVGGSANDLAEGVTGDLQDDIHTNFGADLHRLLRQRYLPHDRERGAAGDRKGRPPVSRDRIDVRPPRQQVFHNDAVALLRSLVQSRPSAGRLHVEQVRHLLEKSLQLIPAIHLCVIQIEVLQPQPFLRRDLCSCRRRA
mmetsp:Transcript_41493/g.109424  ORF Transcript_41493/g.109424 Transcript_41493/m.109424 type:complete len:224 (+) Transcript_41493:721-1392(+)